MLRYCSSYCFSSGGKRALYDTIFVGPLATLVAKHFLYETKGNFTSLVINPQAQHAEQCLIPTSGKPLRVSDIVYRRMENCDLQIQRVLPETNKIQYPDGSEVGYRQLVFTENCEPVYDRVAGLKEALQNPYSMAFTNADPRSLRELYHLRVGELIFSDVPSLDNADDNYLFIVLLSHIRRRNEANPEKKIKFHVKILNEGGVFFPHHEPLEKYLRQLLKENDVEVLDGVSPTAIDHSKRELKLSNGQTAKYAAYYHYMQLKEPSQLEGIASQDISSKTLRNNKYSNITVFGHGEPPTTHSFYALNYQLRVVKQNLVNAMIAPSRQAIYNGDTAIPFWRSNNEVMYWTSNYDGKTRSFGNSWLASRILGLDRSFLGRWEVDSYFKFKHYGWPLYYRHNHIQQVQNTSGSSSNAESLLPPRRKPE